MISNASKNIPKDLKKKRIGNDGMGEEALGR